MPAGTELFIFSFLPCDRSASGSIPGIEPAEKGWAADVDVAAGVSFGRGLVAVDVLAVTTCAGCADDWVRGREVGGVPLRRAERRRRQRRQIIVGVDVLGRKDEV